MGHGGSPWPLIPCSPLQLTARVSLEGPAVRAHAEGQSQGLDVCLELSHPALGLTTLTALLLSLLPYASLMLCPSETIPAARSPRPLRRLAAEGMLTGTGHSWEWVKDVVSTQTIPCPGMARLSFRRDIGEGAFCAGLAGRRCSGNSFVWRRAEVAGRSVRAVGGEGLWGSSEQPSPWQCCRAQWQAQLS